ncbi:hypothetical protein DFH07DRAFT_771988 [Mycena maculata]|uniref:Nephrocystin 3-like N-terminal domain-containing protein n=1 Tax=Mycena maculata TaxID=230809 RepID=A0AAD7JB53_9AGAR|nr:hypothetical protein DFH07DRAFT_771988 [Mycena maculata]
MSKAALLLNDVEATYTAYAVPPTTMPNPKQLLSKWIHRKRPSTSLANSNKDAQIALRRITLQLSAQSPFPYRALNKYYMLSSGQTLPSYEDLHCVLQQLLRELGRTYIVLDALDECNDNDFEQLVRLGSTLRAWTETPLHLLFTSQPRRIFTEGFRGVTRIALEFNTTSTQGDIKLFVASEIQTNPKLKFGAAERTKLQIGLPVKAAEYQLDDKLRQRLPDALFGIYGRFFDAIPAEDSVYVVAVLRWILLSSEQISLQELADAVAFDFSDPAEYVYKPKRRQGNTGVIFDWLERLVVHSSVDGRSSLGLAHASVQDYVLSKQFGLKSGCDLSEAFSHTFISQNCISYLLYFGDHPLEKEEAKETLSTYPLAGYAAEFWCDHLLLSHDRSILFPAAIRLLEDQRYRSLARLVERFLWNMSPSPLHFCCQEGYIEGVKGLIADNSDVNLRSG